MLWNFPASQYRKPYFSVTYWEAGFLGRMLDFPISQYSIFSFSVIYWEAIKLAHAEFTYFWVSYWETTILSEFQVASRPPSQPANQQPAALRSIFASMLASCWDIFWAIFALKTMSYLEAFFASIFHWFWTPSQYQKLSSRVGESQILQLLDISF